jgi:hypothetical protein
MVNKKTPEDTWLSTLDPAIRSRFLLKFCTADELAGLPKLLLPISRDRAVFILDELHQNPKLLRKVLHRKKSGIMPADDLVVYQAEISAPWQFYNKQIATRYLNAYLVYYQTSRSRRSTSSIQTREKKRLIELEKEKKKTIVKIEPTVEITKNQIQEQDLDDNLFSEENDD